ncbi:MAG TPA: TadE/TadG family type IV pilus assembly protein [Ilumatobacteraceae bacterium]|nr:TadE/TadG family type IV pilus assembly protein [Ilumatobacteraceae bacterium]
MARGNRHCRGRRRIEWRDDRGDVAGIEILFSTVFLIVLFLFLCQVVIWWHARNILEQAAAEGARAAAAADASCDAAGPAATGLAGRMGGSWVNSLRVDCGGDGPDGSIVTVTVTATTPMFGIPGSLQVQAVATAPSEGVLVP